MARAFIIIAIAVAVAAGPVRAQADTVTVFAAASLKGALDDIATAFSEHSGDDAVVSFAGSSALSRQIQAGAPADVFISANIAWMDRLETQDLIRRETRVALLANRLVLVTHDTEAASLTLQPGADLATRLGEERLAMALVDAVPAGLYGKAALQSLGLWADVSPRVVQASNVRNALALVALGEALYGIVYATDAAAEDAVSVVDTFPAESHPPIIYPAAETKRATAAAAGFMEFLRSETADSIFVQHGFTVLP